MEDDATIREVASQFATALDCAEWEGASVYLRSDVTCAYRGKRISGRKSVISLYRESAEWAETALDHVASSHEIVDTDDNMVRVRFTEAIEHDGQRHSHESDQLLEVNLDREQITHVTHVDLPGSQVELDAFFDEVGVERE